MEYYNSLTRLMQQHNLTAAKLAELLKCSVRTVRNWECGTSRPGRQLMSALEKVFAVSGSVLFPENVFELADLRKSRNMSEDKLAELVRCDVSVIHEFECKKNIPDKKTLKSIAAVFEIPLYSISVTPPPQNLPHTCAVCGRSFNGGPNAKYCPKCAVERRNIRNMNYSQRALRGNIRTLGSTDICERCGKQYIVVAGNQKFCPDCKAESVKEHDRERARKYYNENKEELNPKRNESRSKISKCVICGKLFENSGKRSTTCSHECRSEYRNRYMRKYRKNH